MKAIVPCGFLHIEVEADTQIDLLTEIGRAQEVFGEEVCGLCQSRHLRYRIRSVTKDKETHDFPELQCRSCWAKLSFGQEKKGGYLFPVRKLNQQGMPDRKTGEYGAHNGWYKLMRREEHSDDQHEDQSYTPPQSRAQNTAPPARDRGRTDDRRPPARNSRS